MKILVTKMANTNNRSIFNGVDIFGRDENGEKWSATITGLKPYMFVEKYDKSIPEVTHYEVGAGKTLKNEPLTKLFVNHPGQIPAVKSHFFTHWEADIKWVDRVRYDCGIKNTIRVPEGKNLLEPKDIIPIADDYSIDFRYAVIDIETWDDGPFPDPEEAPQKIVMFTLWDSFKKKYLLVTLDEVDNDKIIEEFKKQFGFEPDVTIKSVKTESELLISFKNVLMMTQPDIVTGWNFKNFDWPYIIKRMEINNVEFDPKPYAVMDVMGGYKILRETLGPNNLEEVAQNELGVGKLPIERIYKIWETDREKIAAYNIGDVYLTEEINKLKDVLNFHTAMCRFAGSPYEYWNYNSFLVDSYLFHRLKGHVQIPSRGIIQTKKIEAGGLVFEPKKGIFENVAVLDNKSEYPSVMRSLNMSPETGVESGEHPNDEVYTAPSGNQYLKEPLGLIPMIMNEMIESRTQMKEEMVKFDLGTKEYKTWWSKQNATKYFINSFYGVLGAVGKDGKANFRLADGDIGSDVTEIGRLHAKWNADFLIDKGYDIIYGDTDSVMFQLKEFDIEKLMKLEDEMNDSFDEFADQFGAKDNHVFKVELEKVYERFLQSGSKKRYAGIYKWKEGKIRTESIEDRMDIKGYEVRRSNSTKITQKIQKQILMLLLTGEKIDVVREIIMNVRQQIYNGELDKEIAIPCGLSSKAYKGTIPIHARAAAFSNEHLGKNFKYGDRPYWWYVKGVKGVPETNVIALEWTDNPSDYGIVIDYDKMVERALKGPLTPIIETMGLSWDEIISGQEQSSLEEFW